jgi:hypothetical protein
MEAAPKPEGEGDVTPKNELPAVESPPLSPGAEASAPEQSSEPAKAEAPEPIAVPAIIPAVAADEPPSPPRFAIRPRHKRYAVLAASVTFAAVLGAVIGALASGGFSAPAKPDVAALEQSKAMQQSIARLNKDITTLKASLEQANKAAHTQIAKISERLEHQAADITGSISAPQTGPVTTPTPLPTPRPAQRVAAVEAPPARIPLVPDWTIHDYRDGYVFVENHGEVYQVQLGAPLPGLGPVQSVKRQDGRWMVLTPKGMIVSLRDRRYFEDF